MIQQLESVNIYLWPTGAIYIERVLVHVHTVECTPSGVNRTGGETEKVSKIDINENNRLKIYTYLPTPKLDVKI